MKYYPLRRIVELESRVEMLKDSYLKLVSRRHDQTMELAAFLEELDPGVRKAAVMNALAKMNARDIERSMRVVE